MRNPDFLPAPSAEPDPRFMRYVELVTEFRNAGILEWVSDPRKEVEFDIVISDYAPAYSQKVAEYLALLGLPMPADESRQIVLPVYFAIKSGESGGVAITTRSTLDLIEILRAAIEIPQEHAGMGLTIDYPPVGMVGKDIRICASTDKPKNAFLAVKYRGYWFYIDESDQHTKLFYRTMRLFWSVSIASGTDQSAAPVLTLSVGQ